MKRVTQGQKVLHVIVGAGNVDYFLNCIRSVANLDAGDIFAAYNYVSPGDNMAIEAKRHEIKSSVLKLVIQKNQPTKRTGSLYMANNLGLEFARHDYDFANFIQADMQLMWWDIGFLDRAKEIVKLFPPRPGNHISFYTQLPVRGKNKNVYDQWNWDESAHTFRTTGFSDVCLIPLFDGINERMSFDGDEQSMSRTFSENGSALFFHPHPFIAPIPFPTTVRDPQKRNVKTARSENAGILRINPNFPVALDTPTLHPIFMEDVVFPNGWSCSNPYWPSDTKSTMWLRRRFHNYRADPLSLFEIRKAGGQLSRWPVGSSAPGLTRTLFSLFRLTAEETNGFLLRRGRRVAEALHQQKAKLPRAVSERLLRLLTKVAIDRFIPGFPVFREISFDTYSLAENTEELLPSSRPRKRSEIDTRKSNSANVPTLEDFSAIRACVVADATVFYNRRFSPLLVGRNCLLPQRNEPGPWDFAVTKIEKIPGTTMLHMGKTIGFRGGFSKRKIPQALYIGTRSPDNYYHWLVNALPSLHLANQSKLIPPGTPVLVPDIVRTHTQLVEALKVVSKNRPIEYFGKAELIQVKRLFFVDPPPFYDTPLSLERQNRRPLSFHWEAITSYRNHICRTVNLNPRNEGDERLFLLRGTGDPRSANQEELLRVAEEFGFRGVRTELMTFTEQVNLFSAAKFLTGPSGAAFTNILFSRNSRVLLYKDYTDENENFFSLLASVGGGKVFTMISRASEGGEGNFISPARYREGLKKLLSGESRA